MLNQERLGDSINVPSNLKTACKLYCEEVKWSKGGGGGGQVYIRISICNLDWENNDCKKLKNRNVRND